MPYISVTLAYRGRSITVPGLLDTGATVNVLPFNVGLALGAEWGLERIPMYLAGNLAQYEARGLLVFGQVGSFRPVPLAFAWTQTDNVPVILGQVNFFQEFNVCFYRSELAFDIRPRQATK